MKPSMTVSIVSAMLCIACGSAVDEVRQQITAANERLGEVHEIYGDAYDAISAELDGAMGWQYCPSRDFSYSLQPSGESELEQAVHDTATEIQRIRTECTTQHRVASQIARQLAILERRTDERRRETYFAGMEKHLTIVEEGGRTRYAEGLNNLAGEDDDTVWRTLANELFTSAAGKFDDDLTTYPDRAQEMVAELQRKALDAISAREALKQRGMEENEKGRTLYAEWSVEVAGSVP